MARINECKFRIISGFELVIDCLINGRAAGHEAIMNHKIMASKVAGRRSLSRVVRRWVVQVPRQRAAAQTEREPIIAAVGSLSYSLSS